MSMSSRSRPVLAQKTPTLRPRTQLCTSLAGRTLRDMAEDAMSAFAGGADLVEFRFDLLRERGGGVDLAELDEFSPRAIFTVRSPAEGGGHRGSEESRLRLIERVSELRPAYFDVELATLESNPGMALTKPSVNLIVSWHDFARTPSPSRLRSIALRALAHGDLVKLVATANRPTDNLSILSLYEGLEDPPIAFCMGSAGVFSRVMAVHYGTPILYTSLPGRPTAPGQLSLPAALAFRRCIQHG
jgi:3-dehydroquinate dehydratase-1